MSLYYLFEIGRDDCKGPVPGCLDEFISPSYKRGLYPVTAVYEIIAITALYTEIPLVDGAKKIRRHPDDLVVFYI